jgi:hypothetical protein
MSAIIETARETPATATNGSRHIPATRDAMRRVFNALETLRIAARHDGDVQTLLSAEVALDMLQGLRAGRH